MSRATARLTVVLLGLLLAFTLSVFVRVSSVRTLWGNAAVSSLAWSPDGETLAIGSADGSILLWDMALNRHRQTMNVQSDVISLAWSPDSRMIASGIYSDTDLGTITVWDIDSGESIRTIGIATPKLRSLSWSPDGMVLSAGLQERLVLFWDVGLDAVQEVEGFSDEILNIAFSPDGQLLAVGQQDGFITFMDPANRDPAQRVSYSLHDYVADLGWSPDGQILASATCFTEASLPAQCRLVLWNPSNEQYQASFPGTDYDFTSVAWAPSGKYIASAFLNGDVALYNPDTGSRVRTFQTPVGSTLVTWSPDGQTLAAGSEDGSVLLWSIQ